MKQQPEPGDVCFVHVGWPAEFAVNKRLRDKGSPPVFNSGYAGDKTRMALVVASFLDTCGDKDSKPENVHIIVCSGALLCCWTHNVDWVLNP